MKRKLTKYFNFVFINFVLEMHVILNGEPLEEVDCLSTWDRNWQLMEDVKGM